MSNFKKAIVNSLCKSLKYVMSPLALKVNRAVFKIFSSVITRETPKTRNELYYTAV